MHDVFLNLYKKILITKSKIYDEGKNLSQINSWIQALPAVVNDIRLQNGSLSSQNINLHLQKSFIIT